VGDESADVLDTECGGVARLMELDEADNPINVGLLGRPGVVLDAQSLNELSV